MQLLTDASRQLFSRPADEHYESHSAIMTSARRSMETGREVTARQLIVKPMEADDTRGPFRFQLDDGLTVVPNHYSMQQLCGLARIPIAAVQRLTPKTAAQALNESLRHGDGQTQCKVLVELDAAGDQRVRSITSDSYTRVWDLNVLQEVDKWLLPQGYQPALPTMNTDDQQRNVFGNSKPALFRGDRDSFCFYYTEPDQNGADFGGLRRGYMWWNSEVGHRSVGDCDLLFRDMCSNFLIWNATEVRQRRRVHRGDMRPFFLEMRDRMQTLSRELDSVEIQKLERAMVTAFVGDGSPTEANLEKAENRLTREFRVTRQLAKDTVQSALLDSNVTERVPLSFFSIANGLTWEAKDTAFASRALELGNVQKDILQAAGGA